MSAGRLERTESSAHGPDDEILRLVREITVHWQAHDTLCQPFRIGQAARRRGEFAIGAKHMQRACIMDRRRHPGFATSLGQLVAAVGDDRVLSPDRTTASHQLRRLYHLAETFGVTFGASLPRDDLLGENSELLQQNGGLERIEPAIEADLPTFGSIGTSPVAAERG